MALDAARGVQAGIYKGIEGGVADITASALAQADIARYKMDAARYSMELAQQMGPAAPMPKAFNFNYGGTSYEGGKSALDNHNYERAVEIFDKLINSKNQNGRVEGSYYWKAYALNKLGKRDEALAALAELAKQYPQSSWLNDSKALQAEVRQANGQPVSPETQADEDLKLYAINALINSDSERAVPLLEGLLGNPKMSPRLKERALFVLAQSRSDKAHEIVGRYAKSGSNPDLQLVSVQYLGSYRSKESRQILAEVYSSASDVNVKRAVLRSFENSRDVEHLAAITKSEQNVELRREAIRQLGNLRDETAVAGLVAAYSSESDRSIKGEILNSLANQGAVKQMIDCARRETDPGAEEDGHPAAGRNEIEGSARLYRGAAQVRTLLSLAFAAAAFGQTAAQPKIENAKLQDQARQRIAGRDVSHRCFLLHGPCVDRIFGPAGGG